MFSVLWGIVVLLFVFWIAGVALHIAGGLIHLLLVLAIAIAIYNFAMSRDARQR
ncbi:lmo0937 family membrane protein [Phormidesmis priestleyi]